MALLVLTFGQPPMSHTPLGPALVGHSIQAGRRKLEHGDATGPEQLRLELNLLVYVLRVLVVAEVLEDYSARMNLLLLQLMSSHEG
jgi:hypothetical protein